jgi:hypothetical protein
MANKKLKLRLSAMPNKNVFGFRNENNSWFIGNTPVAFDGNILLIDNEKYTLTEGITKFVIARESI